MGQSHQIEGLMQAAMNNIKDMVDVDTIVGEPINEYSKLNEEEVAEYRLPFGGRKWCWC